MIIDSNGITTSTLQENLAVWENYLKPLYGNDFVIKKEGVIDNLATSASLIKMDLENQLLFLTKQMNPYTAEAEWQDYLYSRIGLIRRQSTYTVVQRTCSGTANATITAGTVLIENAATKDQFRLKDDLQLDGTGVGVGSFQAEEIGAIDLPESATINILTPLPDLSGVYYESGNTINLGLDYENDSGFRLRWLQSSALNTSKTTDGLYKSLLDLVSSGNDISIRQNREALIYPDITTTHTLNITLNSAEDDETIGQVILDNITDGVGMQGDVLLDIEDDSGELVEIRFDRSEDVPIYISVDITVEDGYTFITVANDVKTAIIDYTTDTGFSMGQDVIASKLYSSIYSVDGVAEATVLVSDEDANYTTSVEIDTKEIATFDTGNITVDEV